MPLDPTRREHLFKRVQFVESLFDVLGTAVLEFILKVVLRRCVAVVITFD
ncbi:hypothetical protein [Natronorubrum thiooxidans]|nr:hypothetical protein [Natronorubrum thiooxidans]